MHIVQLAYKVQQAKAAALDWVHHHGAGPFYVSENIPLEGVHFNGARSSLDHTSAYGWCGNHMIELVQQNCETPSVFTSHPVGLHHCAYFSPDLDAELDRLESLGYSTAMRANTANGVRFAFTERAQEQSPNHSLGHYFEIYQEHPNLRAFYTMIEEAAQDWDGSEPLRKLG